MPETVAPLAGDIIVIPGVAVGTGAGATVVIGTTPLATLLSVGEVLVWPTVALADTAGSNIARPHRNTMMETRELCPLFRSRMKIALPRRALLAGIFGPASANATKEQTILNVQRVAEQLLCITRWL
jgi:hypothetical protein